MNELLKLSTNLQPIVYREVYYNLSDLAEKKKSEFDQLESMKNQWSSFSSLCRQMITLVDDMWPVNLSDKTLVSNDLKSILTTKSKKARMSMVNGERVHIAIKQQKLKCDVVSKQFKREVAAITNIITAMLE